MARKNGTRRVLDPFCGTATTALSAAYRGHESVTVDINPFLVWFGNAKVARYSGVTVTSTREAGVRAVDAVKNNGVTPANAPPIHNIGRWWSDEALKFLRKLKSGIEIETEKHSPERNLLSVVFCRTLIGLSNAAFNHQSMSFRDSDRAEPFSVSGMEQKFHEDLRFVLKGAKDNPEGSGQVVFGDARSLKQSPGGSFDLMVTSPPYANRMSYIRELRPYMYWLGFLENGRDAGELDWSAIGGTWGVATSRLAHWESPKDSYSHPLLENTLDEIAHRRNRNGTVLAAYVSRYFSDMWAHIRSLPPLIEKGGELHYIVGNSTFYGVHLPVEKIYASMLRDVGFEDVKCRAIRKRNSKKELFEFDVSAHRFH